jgi:tetratricopeptide (TPR) repeat protein
MKIEDPSDYRPGTKKARLIEKKIWLVQITMPKSLMGDIRTGSVELEDQEIDLKDLAKATEGYSGADIAALCREAGMQVLRKTMDSGSDKVSMAEFKKAMELGSDNENTRIGLSTAYRGKREFHLALKELKIALNRSPSDARLYFELGQIYLQMGDQAQALAEFNRALELGGDSQGIHIAISRVYQQRAEFFLAEQEIESTLKENPDALIISTPPDLHVKYALQAAKHDKHFFMEASVVDDGITGTTVEINPVPPSPLF